VLKTGAKTPKEVFSVDNQGNVGIGTANPGKKLHVKGGMKVTDSSGNSVIDISAENTTSSSFTGHFKTEQGGYLAIGQDTSLGGLKLQTNNTTRMVIKGNGKVGVGTVSPTKKLEVLGSIYANNTLNSIAYQMQSSQYSGTIAPLSTVNTYSLGYSKDGTKHSSVLAWNANGNVGIGTTSPALKLYINGTAGGTSAWSSSSDRKLKRRIRTIARAKDKVYKLRGVSFEWKDTTTHPRGPQIGLVAQEVKRVLPEVVSKKGKHYSIQYGPMVALLVEAMKEQQQEINTLKKELRLMKSRRRAKEAK